MLAPEEIVIPDAVVVDKPKSTVPRVWILVVAPAAV
jgi:hypothetical protein